MDTAAQLLNAKFVCNITPTGVVKDLVWGEVNPLERGHLQPLLYANGEQVSFAAGNVQVDFPGDNYPANAVARFEVSANNVNVQINYSLFERGLVAEFTLKNLADFEQKLDLFLDNQVDFSSDRARDTAVYYPGIQGIVHYYGQNYLGISADLAPTDFSCQAPEDFEGRGALPKELKLTNNPVTTGRANSCLHYTNQLPAVSEWRLKVYYIFGNDFAALGRPELSGGAAAATLPQQSQTGIRQRLVEKAQALAQSLQLGPAESAKLEQLLVYSYYSVFNSFREVGGNFAALDSTYIKRDGSDDYNYFWGRDGGLAFLALVHFLKQQPVLPQEFQQLASNYFTYLAKAFGELSYLRHRYLLDKDASLASSWYVYTDPSDSQRVATPLQLDQTCIAVLSAAEFVREFPRATSLARPFLAKLPVISTFLLEQIGEDGAHKPCHDLWENHEGQFTSTQVSLIAAIQALQFLQTQNYVIMNVGNDQLQAAQDRLLAALHQKFVRDNRWGRATDDTIHPDSADLHWLWKMGVVHQDDPKLGNTFSASATSLRQPAGFLRYSGDYYLRQPEQPEGNVWPLANLWFAQYYLSTKQFPVAAEVIRLTLEHMETTGLLAEMFHPQTGMGLSLRPLIWNHAEVLNLLRYS